MHAAPAMGAVASVSSAPVGSWGVWLRTSPQFSWHNGPVLSPSFPIPAQHTLLPGHIPTPSPPDGPSWPVQALSTARTACSTPSLCEWSVSSHVQKDQKPAQHSASTSLVTLSHTRGSPQAPRAQSPDGAACSLAASGQHLWHCHAKPPSSQSLS